MKESSITASILRWLRTLGWAVKLHGSAWQQPGLPDILAIIDGRTVFFEVKRPGGVVSAIQRVVHERIRAAGGEVHVVRSLEEARGALQLFSETQ